MGSAKQLIAAMLSDHKQVDEAYFSDKLFNIYYDLKELVGDEEIVTELLRSVPEKVLLPVLTNMQNRLKGEHNES